MLQQDRVIKINIENEMKTAYIDYSMSVIVARALPDVRDGLKPVHRRVLYGMDVMGNNSSKPYKKAANCVGEVMAKYHPHGDSSIYGTVVRLAQPWAMRYTLVDGHGNFGSVDGDSPAAMRYTEVRLRRLGERMLDDIDKDTVDMQRNYDNTRDEPTVLPTRFPNLLVNGAAGIAVGMATNMPPHNLTESINGAIALLDNPDMTVADLMKYVTAPDFPTGGTIYGYAGVRDAYETGRGRIVIRARAEIVAEDRHENIIINEIPYNVNKAELVAYIAQLVTEKKIVGITDVRDESSKEGMRIVIKVASDANANVILNKLYKMTQLQASFSVNNVALVDGRPRLLNLKDILSAFNKHRHEVVIRRTQFELAKAQERAHILDGLIIACDNIDEVIAIIRSTPRDEDPRVRLMERFGLSERQAQAVVDMQLKRLSGLEQEKLHEDKRKVMEEIARYELILSDEETCRQLIKDELIEVRDTYGDVRKTDIDYMAGDFNAEDFYSDDDMVITISHLGYIKRTPLTEFRAQGRGGVGAKGSDTRDEDFIEAIYTGSMHNHMLFFTRKGRCYWLKVYELPEGAKNSKGRAIQNLLNIESDDTVNCVIPVRSLNDPDYVARHNLVFCTRNGIVKKTPLEAYSRPRANGVNAILIREGDSLINVVMTDGNNEIVIANRNGRAIRFPESKVRTMGRVATGVRAMRLDEDGQDEVVGMIAMEAESNNSVLVLSQNGYGKRTQLDAYRVTNRGGKGVKTMKITEKTGYLVGILSVNDEMDLMIINISGITLRMNISAIREMGRATQGLRLINLEKRNDTIASICAVATDPEEEVDNELIDTESEPLEEDLLDENEIEEEDDAPEDDDEAEEGTDENTDE